MSSSGAAPRAAVPTSNARAEASRKNGARSRGPKTPEGKARSSQNALKHGLRAQKYLVLPDEDGAEFAALEAALIEELAPVGPLQSVLAQRVVSASWRLARADRLEAEVFEVRSYANASPGLALIRDGNGTRSIETLMRYRGAAMAELMRSLRTLKALQAEQAALGATALEGAPKRTAARPPVPHRPQPNQPEPHQPEPCPKPNKPESRLAYAPPEPPSPGPTLHEPAARWQPNEPETGPGKPAAPDPRGFSRNRPEHRRPDEPETPTKSDRNDRPRPHRPPSGMRATESQGRMDRLNKCRAHG
jgi:hypothetical protein